jgi:hypothetical protein
MSLEEKERRIAIDLKEQTLILELGQFLYELSQSNEGG